MIALGLIALTFAGGAHASARPTAQRYLDAIARGDEQEICHLLSPSAKHEIREDEPGTTCNKWAHELPPQLGKYPIVKVKFPKPGLAEVTIGDHEFSDSGDEVLEMSHASGRWLITSP